MKKQLSDREKLCAAPLGGFLSTAVINREL